MNNLEITPEELDTITVALENIEINGSMEIPSITITPSQISGETITLTAEQLALITDDTKFIYKVNFTESNSWINLNYFYVYKYVKIIPEESNARQHDYMLAGWYGNQLLYAGIIVETSRMYFTVSEMVDYDNGDNRYQFKLTAGSNITISNNVISATVPTKTSELTNDSGFLTEHQSLSAYRTSAAQDIIDATKQDTISDLSTIRSGAALGATAIQPNDNVSELNNDAGYLTQHQSLAAYSTTTEMNTAIANHHDSTKQEVLDSSGANANVIAPLYVDTGELRIELGNGVHKTSDNALEVKPGTGILVSASGVNVDTDVIATVSSVATKLDASKSTYQTTAPTAAISDGGIHIVYLSSEPATKYSGYIYMIAES